MLFIALVPLPKSQNNSLIAFFDYKASMLKFYSYNRLFLLGILSLILLLIISSKLFF